MQDARCTKETPIQHHPWRHRKSATHQHLVYAEKTGILSTPDSLYRDTRVRNLLSKNPGSITSKQVKEALFDKYQEPWSVCRPERPGFTGNLSATVAMVVMQPELGIMEVAMLPAQDRRFVRYTLDRTVNRKGGSKSRRGNE